MNIHGAGRLFGVVFAAAVASGAICANAQTAVSAPADPALQRVAARTSPPGTRPDTSIIRDVRRALRRVPDLDDSEIHIRASRGVVTLTGWVPQTWQIARAGRAARSVHGVRALTNRLKAREEHDEHGNH